MEANCISQWARLVLRLIPQPRLVLLQDLILGSAMAFVNAPQGRASCDEHPRAAPAPPRKVQRGFHSHEKESKESPNVSFQPPGEQQNVCELDLQRGSRWEEPQLLPGCLWGRGVEGRRGAALGLGGGLQERRVGGSYPHTARACRSGANQPRARMRVCVLGQGRQSNCSQQNNASPLRCLRK